MKRVKFALYSDVYLEKINSVIEKINMLKQEMENNVEAESGAGSPIRFNNSREAGELILRRYAYYGGSQIVDVKVAETRLALITAEIDNETVKSLVTIKADPDKNGYYVDVDWSKLDNLIKSNDTASGAASPVASFTENEITELKKDETIGGLRREVETKRFMEKDIKNKKDNTLKWKIV